MTPAKQRHMAQNGAEMARHAIFMGKPSNSSFRITGVDLSIRKDIAEIKAKLDILINLGGTK
jgi:hypothetical protein